MFFYEYAQFRFTYLVNAHSFIPVFGKYTQFNSADSVNMHSENLFEH
jgi:hypothetical protein